MHAYVLMAYAAMTYIVTAYTVMTYIVMAIGELASGGTFGAIVQGMTPQPPCTPI